MGTSFHLVRMIHFDNGKKTTKETATLFRTFQFFGQLVSNIAVLDPNNFLCTHLDVLSNYCYKKLPFRCVFGFDFFRFRSITFFPDTIIDTIISSYFIHNNKLLTFPTCFSARNATIRLSLTKTCQLHLL